MKNKKWMSVLVMALAVCLLSWQAMTTAQDEQKNTDDEWDVLLKGKTDISNDVGQGPGMGQGDQGFDPGGRGGFGGGGRFGGGLVETDQLLDFLTAHEPELAKKLENLSENDPDRFEAQLPTLRRLYGPVVRQMDRDPESAELSLKKIRLRLKIQKLVETAKSVEKSEKGAIKKQLSEPVGQLFDVIIKAEELSLSRFSERMESFSGRLGPGQEGTAPGDRRGRGGRADRNMDRGDARAQDMEPGDARDQDMEPADARGGRGMGPADARGGRGMGPGPGRDQGMGPNDRQGRGMGGGRGMGPEMFRERLESRKAALKSWQERKTQIVNNRANELLEGYEAFPWGR